MMGAMNNWLCIAAVNGALAVLCGAFAVHGLQGRLDAHALEIFQTGARYHMVHALAMGLAALSGRPGARWAAGLFLAGIVLFSGSLYALALTGVIEFAFVTPVGGLAFVAGWIALAFAARRTA
jgi:uncharacterized membrane protein YgdD (TMEM256/DUF423 family)